jgi:hypothetical protein
MAKIKDVHFDAQLDYFARIVQLVEDEVQKRLHDGDDSEE